MLEAERFVIALINRKGGVTKTTSAAYISMCLHQAGKTVTAVDADPDQSLIKWNEAANFPFTVLPADNKNIDTVVKGLQGYVVIDSPPNDGEIVFATSLLADEVIVPLSATGLDVNRLSTTLTGVTKVEEARGKALTSVLITKWRHNLIIGKEALEILKENNIPLLEQKIPLATRYEGFGLPEYLDEYQAVLKELEIL